MFKYLTATLLLLLNLYNYENGLNSIVFLVLGVILIVLNGFFCYKQNKSIETTIIEMLCYTWPISWINIFGNPTSELQLPWFYILGFIYVIVFLLKNRKITLRRRFIDICFVIVFLYIAVPLIKSNDFVEGLADYIMIMFFVILTFFAYKSKSKINVEKKIFVGKSFIFINLLCAIIMIFQYVNYTQTGVKLFKMNIAGSFAAGSVQVGSELLFEDASSATIMLGCGVIYALCLARKEKKYYLFAFIIIVGLALSSRRTAVVALIIALVPYFLIQYKGASKVVSIVLLCGCVLGLVFFITIVRPVDDISQLIDDNGRFADYESSLTLIYKEPLGVGFGDSYLETLMNNQIIPHNTILRWFNMGGALLAMPLLFILLLTLYKAFKEKKTSESWALFYSLIAMNFIPDILNARFMVILCMIIYLFESEGKEYNSENKNINYSSSL